MQIQKIRLRDMRNDAHFQFMTEFRDLMVRCGAQNLKIAPQFNEWLVLYGREDESLKRIVKSAITQQIHAADKARDDIFSALSGLNDVYLKHYDADIAAASKRLKVIFETYGNIAKKPINDQTSAINNILQDLRSPKYIGDSRLSGLVPWMDELEKRNNTFEILVKERFDEAASKSGIVLRDARHSVDDSYRKICEIINVFIILEGAAAYDTFVKTLNVIIQKYGGRHDRTADGHTSSD